MRIPASVLGGRWLREEGLGGMHSEPQAHADMRNFSIKPQATADHNVSNTFQQQDLVDALLQRLFAKFPPFFIQVLGYFCDCKGSQIRVRDGVEVTPG